MLSENGGGMETHQEHQHHTPQQHLGDGGPAHGAQHGYLGNKEDYLNRLRRIEGQTRGLQRMVSEEQYCIDILTQISATTKALESLALGLLHEHLSHCVVRAAKAGGEEAAQKIAEASQAIARLVRS
jgi:DNA-binding FrmR family transcriptional regulator